MMRCTGKPMGKSNLENLCIDGNIKMEFQEERLGAWTGLIWLWTGTGGGSV